ncbi:PepSY domain-containing protein [Francisellaceae bacterium]|nr:PepSY domain-containing protein [Francisellaceae bacterium]
MKKITIIASSVLLSTSLISTSLFADSDRIPKSAVPIGKIITNLQDKGYKAIKSVEFDNGGYEAEVVTDQGQELDLSISPATGEIINPPKALAFSMNDALKKAEKAGYVDAYEIEAEDGGYKIKAFEANSQQKEKIFINGQNGILTTGGGFW